MKIIVAIDSFKGCLTSAEANQAASEGIISKVPEAEVVQVPVSDGGERKHQKDGHGTYKAKLWS